MNVGQDEYESYLSSVEYIDVIKTFAVEEAKWEYSSRKSKCFEVKYLTKISLI